MTTATYPKTNAAAPSVMVETVSSVRQFEALGDEWNDLLRASDSDCLFLTWEWLYTWWKHLAEDRELSILAVRHEGKLVALAPVALRPANLLRRRPLPAMEFLGSGYVGSDYLDLIVRRGYEASAQQAFAGAFSRAGVVLEWTQLRLGNCFAPAVASCLAGKGWSFTETPTNTCPFITISGMSWEEYLATLGAEHRYNFHRKWRRINRDYRVVFERVERGDQCRESIDMLIGLHNLRWRERGGSDAFHAEGLIAFHREFSRIACERGWLRLYVLRLNDTPVASLYGFRYGRTFYFYQSGFDPAYRKLSAGLVTMGLGIRSAIEEGADEYDLLHGDEDYKAHWSSESRELNRLEVYPPGAAGRICQRAAHLERSARKLARRALTRIAE